MGLLDRLFGKKNDTAVPELTPALRKQAVQPEDWSNSEIHLILLDRFIDPKPADRVPSCWESALGEPPEMTIKRFIKNGLLVPASLQITVELCNTGTDLKNLLKERGLKVSGKKQELAERLVKADEKGMAELHARKTIVQCSSEIQPRVKQYVADKEREFDDAVADALAALRTKDFAKASRVIGAYESKQLCFPVSNPMAIPLPPRETEKDVKALKKIFTLRPKILKELAENEWEPLHIAYALSHLLHGRLSHDWLPDGFVGVAKYGIATTVRMLGFNYSYFQHIESMRAAGITQGSILCSGPHAGSCEACMKRNEMLFDLDSMPELPYENCTCHMGCRCLIKPILPGV